MKKSAIPVLTVLLFLAAVTAFAFHGPAKITIDAKGGKQGPVALDHHKHQKLTNNACDKCHHMNKGLTDAGAAKAKVAKCSTCHTKAQGKLGTIAEASLTKNPYHVNCIGCHKAQKKGPVACTGCHKKA